MSRREDQAGEGEGDREDHGGEGRVEGHGEGHEAALCHLHDEAGCWAVHEAAHYRRSRPRLHTRPLHHTHLAARRTCSSASYQQVAST